MRKRGIVRQGAREADQLALADRKRGAALADRRVQPLRQGIEEWPEADFAQGALDGRAVDGFGAQADVGFERAGEEERVLQHDAELAAQFLHVQFANVDAVEQDLAALDVVEAQQELNGGGFAGAGVADDGDGLTGLDAEGDVAQDPIVFAGIGAAVIGEPDVAKFDFAAHEAEGASAAGDVGGQRLVEQREDALGGGHGRLQDVEFVAEVLNGLEEALRVLHEGDQHADRDRAGERSQAAVPEDGDDGDDAEKFDGRDRRARRPGWRPCRLPCAGG